MIIKKLNNIMPKLRLIIDTENPRARNWLIQSRKTNNPAFALLNAWTEFEYQIKNYNRNKYRNSVVKSRFMIDECAAVLDLSKSDIDQLFQIRNTRNGISHGLIERNEPEWSDVYFLLDLVKKYKISMREMGREIIMEEE